MFLFFTKTGYVFSDPSNDVDGDSMTDEDPDASIVGVDSDMQGKCTKNIFLILLCSAVKNLGSCLRLC